MAFTKARRALPPLDEQRLTELALRYVGRYATTRAKLCQYLQRKVRERGWREGGQPDVEALANRFAERGYIDDASYGLAKSRSLTSRGYGKRRVVEALRLAGVDEDDGLEAVELADTAAAEAALRFAEKRRFGPFAQEQLDPQARQRAFGAMLRAGHSPGLTKAILALAPGVAVDPADLSIG